MARIKDYVSAEEFDLMNDDELDSLDLDYQYEKYLEELSEMNSELSFSK